MVRKSSYDDLETDYFDEEVGGSFLSLMSLGVAFLAVAAFIALAWYAYQDDGVEEGEIETIYAQEGDIRLAPEGESGWQFPDADRQVYQLGSGAEEDMSVEQILPQPERPAPRAQAEEGVEGWINKEDVAGNEPIGLTDAERRKMEEIAKDATQAVKSGIVNTPATPAPEVVVAAKKETVTKVAKPAEVAKPKPAPVVKKKPAPVVAKKKESSNKSAVLTRNRLQLGAFGSRADALKNWGKIKSRNSSLLGSKKAHIEVAEVKGKTYYRVQAYPFTSRAKADALCVMLKSRNQPCFAVKK